MSWNRRRMLPVFLYVLLILAVSSIPSLTAPGPSFAAKDKVAHFIEYGILGALLFRGFGWSVSLSRAATFAFLFAAGTSVAAFDEAYQSFVPGRMMSVYDWAADALGLAAGLGLFVFTPLGKHPGGGRADAPGPRAGTPPAGAAAGTPSSHTSAGAPRPGERGPKEGKSE